MTRYKLRCGCTQVVIGWDEEDVETDIEPVPGCPHHDEFLIQADDDERGFHEAMRGES